MPRKSALLTPADSDPTWENQIPVAADHRDMCRFASSKDPTYKTFVSSVKEILKADQPEITNEFFKVSVVVNPQFTGRHDIREVLRENLIENRHAGAKVQQRFVLYGLGGSGKTQICLKFAQEYREK